MAAQNTNPFYGSSNGGIPANGGQQRLALDNLIRRELKVGDPNDSKQIADALFARFKDDPRANAINQEANGLPFLQSASTPALMQQAPTSCAAEIQQAKEDVERDLNELLTNSLLKDITPEIQGWAQGVRSAIQEGTAAARFALDPRQRDKAFAIRRQLGDYARMARLVGALTPVLNLTYRKFAQSLDEVSAVLLVMMGEALSNVGFNGGRFLLQTPYTELQTRRDAAIYALRNLTGATQYAYTPNDWPRGLDAYRVLFSKLEEQGQGDLRSLLVEIELARTMDELIQRAAHGTVDGLRALGSTAQLDLERFRRLVMMGDRVVVPPSPPLSAFLEALQLFTDAFEASGGFRLLRIARPPILFYGLYGTRTLDDSDNRLLQLIIQRGLLADRLDCFMSCGCDNNAVKCQVILDKILYDVDRAIDLYAVGTKDFGYPERRAAAYSFVIEAFDTWRKAGGVTKCDIANIEPILAIIKDNLLGAKIKLIPAQVAALQTLGNAITALLPAFDSGLSNAIGTAQAKLTVITVDLANLALFSSLAQQGVVVLKKKSQSVAISPVINDINQTFEINGVATILKQELCVQKEMEAGWENLVKSMAPDCMGIDSAFVAIKTVINNAIDLVSDGKPCPSFDPRIPPHIETSLGETLDI